MPGRRPRWSFDRLEDRTLLSDGLAGPSPKADPSPVPTSAIAVSSPTEAGGPGPPASASATGLASIATGDFNGDNLLDLALADPASASLSVFPGNGDGTFQAPIPLATAPGSVPVAVVSAGFTGRTNLDLAVAERGPNDLRLYVGDGTGQFQSSSPISLGVEPVGLVAGAFSTSSKLPDLAVATTAGISVLINNGNGSFASPVTYASGARPESMVAGKFLGSSVLDLAFVDANTGEVDVLPGLGDGTFGALQVTGLVASPRSPLVSGAFTHDGHDDLAYFVGGDLAVIAAGAAGNFGVPLLSPLSPPAGTPSRAVVSDFDGDKNPDVAVASPGSGAIAVLYGQGDGHFQPPINVGTAPWGVPTALTARDVDGSRRTALIFAGGSPAEVDALLNPGERGLFAAAGSFATAPRDIPLVANIGAGNSDLFTIDEAGRILWYRGSRSKPGTTTTYAAPVVVNRGLPSSAFAVLGSGASARIASVDALSNEVDLFAWHDGKFVKDLPPLSTGPRPVQILAGDLTGTGQEDLVVLNAGDQTVTILSPEGAGFRSQTIPVGGDAPGLHASGINLIDTTGAGHRNLVVTYQSSAELQIFQVSGQGDVNSTILAGLPVAASSDVPPAVAAGALKPGGPIDLVAINPASRSFSLFVGLGGGAFAAPRVYTTQAVPVSVRIGDFEGDGMADVAILGSDGMISVYKASGDGGLSFCSTIDAGHSRTGLSVAPLSRRGKPVLLSGDSSGGVLVSKSNRAGSFSSYPVNEDVTIGLLPTGPTAPGFVYSDPARNRVLITSDGMPPEALGGLTRPGAATLIDLNGDGIPDLIVANSGGNDVLVYLGLGGGRFGPALNQGFAAGVDPVAVTVADVNQDGRPDLIVANEAANTVSILLNQVKGSRMTFVPGPTLEAGAGPVETVVGDFTGQGVPQLLILDSGSNEVLLLPGLKGGVFDERHPTTFAVGNDPVSMFVGKFAGGPGLDLATVNSGSNSVTILQDFAHAPKMLPPIPTGGKDPVSAFAVNLNVPGAAGAGLVVANRGDGRISLITLGPSGAAHVVAESIPGLPHPSSLAQASLSDGNLLFYATNSGNLSASLLRFDLGSFGAPASSPMVGNTAGSGAASLPVPAALPELVSLLTVAVEPSQPALGLREFAIESEALIAEFTPPGPVSGSDQSEPGPGPGGEAPSAPLDLLLILGIGGDALGSLLLSTGAGGQPVALLEPLGDSALALVVTLLSETAVGGFASPPNQAQPSNPAPLKSGEAGIPEGSSPRPAVAAMDPAALVWYIAGLGVALARARLEVRNLPLLDPASLERGGDLSLGNPAAFLARRLPVVVGSGGPGSVANAPLHSAPGTPVASLRSGSLEVGAVRNRSGRHPSPSWRPAFAMGAGSAGIATVLALAGLYRPWLPDRGRGGRIVEDHHSD